MYPAYTYDTLLDLTNTQIHDMLTDRKELEHELKLQQMTPEIAARAKRIWAMNEARE